MSVCPFNNQNKCSDCKLHIPLDPLTIEIIPKVFDEQKPMTLKGLRICSFKKPYLQELINAFCKDLYDEVAKRKIKEHNLTDVQEFFDN